MVFSNPATRQADVDYLIDEIERLGKDLWDFNMSLNTSVNSNLKKSVAEDNKRGIL